jgi:hypothetical protein
MTNNTGFTRRNGRWAVYVTFTMFHEIGSQPCYRHDVIPPANFVSMEHKMFDPQPRSQTPLDVPSRTSSVHIPRRQPTLALHRPLRRHPPTMRATKSPVDLIHDIDNVLVIHVELVVIRLTTALHTVNRAPLGNASTWEKFVPVRR